MNLEPSMAKRVHTQLNNQHALKAALYTSMWCIPILLLWYGTFAVLPKASPLMLFVSGALLGVAVRYHGKGFMRRFAVLALLAHIIVVGVAINIGIVLSGTIWGIILLALYVSGAWAAAFFARRSVPLTDHRAFYLLSEQQPHASRQQLKNRSYVAFPVLLLGASFCCAATALAIHVVHGARLQQQWAQDYQQQLTQHREKSIDVTPQALQGLSTEQAFYYAYSYYTGRDMRPQGQMRGAYPHSPFKAQTILRYLLRYRQQPRAAFILARTSEGAKRGEYLQQAVSLGDNYAKFYSVVDYGCGGHETRAKELLTAMASLTQEGAIGADIDTVLHYGFDVTCADFDNTEFQLRFIRDYRPDSD